MGTMVLSKPKGSFYDSYRSKFVAATPEEIVRQKLLSMMVSDLGFPKDLIAVEKELSLLPHLKGKKGLPKRRSDVLCFAKGIHQEYPLFPLLLIECKEGDLNQDAYEQALGYNHYVQAPYVGLAGKEGAFMIHPERVPFLPKYTELLEMACKR